jgi:hypothetical protein
MTASNIQYQFISCEEFAKLPSNDIIIFDCRKKEDYDKQNVKYSNHVMMENPLIRKRLKNNPLFTNREETKKYMDRIKKENKKPHFVLYDDHTCHKNALDNNHSLKLAFDNIKQYCNDAICQILDGCFKLHKLFHNFLLKLKFF